MERYLEDIEYILYSNAEWYKFYLINKYMILFFIISDIIFVVDSKMKK